MTHVMSIRPLRVVIAGGGIAALETVLAIHDLTGARLDVTVVAPEADFLLRPLTVTAPFARGHAERLALAEVMAEHCGHFIQSTVAGIDETARTAALADGSTLKYDLLVLAPGAVAVPAFAHAMTFGPRPLDLNGILADLEQGWSGSLAFVVPDGCSWALPLYELALMTAEEVWSMDMDAVIHFVTPELEPLEIFGARASASLAALLDSAKIEFHGGVRAQINHNGRIETGTGPDIVVDRVVALPALEGSRIDGIPSSPSGFIAVDDTGLIDGFTDVYAVGDATDRPIKQGGLACQQADVTAAHIAARAGAGNDVPALRQVLRGRLLTGKSDRFLERGHEAADGVMSDDPLWWPPAKVSGKYLAPYLVSKGVVHLPARNGDDEPGVDVYVPLTWQERRQASILGLNSLGPIPHKAKSRSYV